MFKPLLSRIISFLRKRWPDRFELLDPTRCHFVDLTIPAGVRVNRSFIQLNYMSLSPFESPHVVYFVKNKRLHLCFVSKVKGEILHGNRFLFPESFLLSLAFGHDAGNLVLVFEEEERTEIVLLKDGLFCSQLVKATLTNVELESTVGMLAREYGMQGVGVRSLKADERTDLIDRGLSRINLAVLQGCWITGERSRQELVIKLISFARPLIAFLLFTTVFEVGGVWLLQNRIAKSRAILANMQTDVVPLLKERKRQGDEFRFWKQFVGQEVNTVSLLSAYQIVAETVSNAKGELKRWSGVKGTVSFTVVVEDAASLLDVLRKKEFVRSIRFEGSVRKERHSERQQATFAMELDQQEET